VAVFCFGVALERGGAISIARTSVETSRAAGRAIRDRAASDAEKESAVRDASIALLGNFVTLVVRTALAVAVSAVPLLVIQFLGLARLSEVTSWLGTPTGLIVGSVAMILVYFATARRGHR
jgi:hypothetical protein